MTIPIQLIKLIKCIPDDLINQILSKANKTIAQYAKNKTGKDGLIYLLETEQISVLEKIYNPISIILTGLGCVGGPVGFAANIIDGLFCYIFGNIPGLVIDIISALCMLPAVKGVLKIGNEASKLLLTLIKNNKNTCLSIEVFSKVVKKLRKHTDLSKFILRLYELYRTEFKCSKEFIRQIQEWLYLNSPNGFKIIEESLKKSSRGVNTSSSIMNKSVGKFGNACAGEIAVEGQSILNKGIKYETRNYYLFINPLRKTDVF